VTKVNTDRWPHIYTGPATPWGLEPGTACRIVGSQGGGKVIRTPHTETTYIVSKLHLIKA
jgi:hypothetical protein